MRPRTHWTACGTVPSARVTSGRVPIVIALAGLVVACVAAYVMGTPAPSLRGDAAARVLLDTWRQSRNATFVVDSDFTRTVADGQQLEDTTRVVQHPPNDRLTTGFGSVSGRLNGHIYRCAATSDTTSTCLQSTLAPDYESEVDHEVATLASYVQGDRPLYRVTAFSDQSDPCFRLDLAVDVPAPPYGRHALFCFDRTTLAPNLTVIERDEGIDRTQATSIKNTVTEADLQVPR